MAEEKENVNRLAEAMHKMKETNLNEDKTAFVKELLFTKFNVPVNISPEPENGVVKPGSMISYMSIKNNQDGKKLLLTFSSREEYNKFMKNNTSSHIVIHPYNEVRSLVTAKKFDGFIIDPAGENVAVSTELIKKIAENVSPLQVRTEKVKNDGDGALRPASNVPQGLKDTLSAYFETQPEIKKCYLMETTRENEPNPTLITVVEFDGDIQKTFNGIANAVRKHLNVNDTIGMMSLADSVAAAAVVGLEPFYTKE